MNCSLADGLMDDYIDNELSPRERSQLEAHLVSCVRCMEELRRRTALDRSLRQALGAAVQRYSLPGDRSVRLVRQAQHRLAGEIRRHRAALVLQAAAGLLVAALVVVGVYVLLGRLSLPAGLDAITLSPFRQFLQSGREIVEVTPDGTWDPEAMEPPASGRGSSAGLSLSASGSFIDPEPLVPGEQFTITLLLHNDLPRTLDKAQFDLAISGPTGFYQFPLSIDGPLPARGISLVRVTTEALAGPCQEKYMMPPTDIFRLPGTYKVRFTLYGPGTEPER